MTFFRFQSVLAVIFLATAGAFAETALIPLWDEHTPLLFENETAWVVLNDQSQSSWQHLGDGWRGLGIAAFMASDTDFWARSRIADMQLTVLRPRDLELHLVMRPAFVESLGAQRVEVVWNGVLLGSCQFDLKKGWESQPFSFAVPQTIQKRGENQIRFVSRFAASRKDVNLDEDRRRHSFSLTRLALTDPGQSPAEPPPTVLFREGESVRQPANTRLKFPFRVPESGKAAFCMGVPVPVAEGAPWAVWLRTDGVETPIEIKIFKNGDKGPYVFDLAAFRGQAVEVILDTTAGDPPSAITWARLRLEQEATAPAPAPAPGPAHAENVLLIVADAARADALGCYGAARQATPELDKLAADGVRFGRAYSPASATYSAVWSLTTSLYPFQHNAPEEPLRAPENAPRLGQTLKAAGLYSGCISQVREVSPQTGIAEHYDEYGRAVETDEMLASGGRPDLVTAQAVDFLNRNKDRRFFLYLHFRQPREPYIASASDANSLTVDPVQRVTLTEPFMLGLKTGEATLNREENIILRARYDECLRAVDREVATIMEYLGKLGLDKSTLVIFTSAHGEAFGEHGFYTHGRTLYEEVTQVPLLLWGAGIRDALPATVDRPVSIIDLYPTICAVTGAEQPAALSGCSLLQTRAHDGIQVFAQGNWAVAALNWDPLEAYWWARYKMIRNAAGADMEVYDLQRDPEERINLAPFRPVLTDCLLAQALAWPGPAPVKEPAIAK